MNVNDATPSRTDGPAKIAAYAVHGWGKTTLGCHLPNPIVVGPEKGIPRNLGFTVKELHPTMWMQLFETVHSLTYDRHPYDTLVLDTIDWIEPMIHRFVCARDSERKTQMNEAGFKLESIEDYGYGKGYLVAEEEFRKLITVIDILQAKREMHVAMLMHSITRTFKNPAGPDFDRFEPQPHQRISKVVAQWAENLIFGFFQVDAAKISEDKERSKKARAKGIGSGIRMIGAQDCATYDAKNRVGMDAEFELGEDLTGLIDQLLGRNVKVKDRRAPVSEMRERGGDQPQGGPPASLPNEIDTKPDAIRESREWTEPKRPNGDASRGARAPDPHPNAPVNGGDKTEDPAVKKLRLDLEAAQKRAKKLGEKYERDVNGWIERAKGDPKKVESIIKRIDADLAPRA